MTGSVYGVAQQQRDADVEEGEFGAGRRAQAREAVGGGSPEEPGHHTQALQALLRCSSLRLAPGADADSCWYPPPPQVPGEGRPNRDGQPCEERGLALLAFLSGRRTPANTEGSAGETPMMAQAQKPLFPRT